MAGAKLGETALRQIAEMLNAFEKRLLNREVNRFRAPIAGQSRYLGKTKTSVNAGNSVTVQIYTLGEAITAEPAKGDERYLGQEVENCYSRNADIPGDEWVVIEWLDGGWEIDTSFGGCPSQNAIHDITLFGSPTGGTFDIDLTVNGSEETLTFNYDDTAAEVETELETHTEIASGDVDVTGGPFPNATIRIEFVSNLAETAIALPLADWGSITGGSGVGVICAAAQLGG